MTRSDHDDGSQSTQVEHVVSNHGDGSQSVQGKQTDNNHDDGSQSIQGEQADSNHGNGSQPVQEDELAVPGSNIVEFDFSTLRQHPALTIEKTGDNVQMIVDLEFSQLESPSDIEALLQALIDYAAVIYDVKILIKAPKEHHNVAACEGRIATVSMVISVLNTFHLAKVEVIARLDDYDSFEQLDPTIAAYKLRFRNWTLAYEVLGLDGKWEIPVDSEDELRLRGRYRKLFFKRS
ncbi:hypothetical protein BTUL_0237g00140 [Botrytis tulipae]|uniref:Uncharacterized protein n=1 Tax=Botrytis tulipae TaxID=87230 RepID=A0A4Z1EF55_9HELO|nr:hypothetical protein BTUL_0237g00140 [Botrytis tulipae]